MIWADISSPVLATTNDGTVVCVSLKLHVLVSPINSMNLFETVCFFMSRFLITSLDICLAVCG